MNDNTSETTKKKDRKKQKRKNRIGEDIDKKSTTHTIEQAVQWPTSVALNTHTLKGLGVVDIINRLEQSVFRRWAGKVFQILGALQQKLFSKVTVLALNVFNSVRWTWRRQCA